jgi:nitronate monooxygenase
MVLERLEHPIVLAPLGGGPSTPELAAAVSGAGGLGFLAAGYLSADALEERIAAVRQMTRAPFGVNVFVPGAPAPAEAYEGFVEGLRQTADRAGAPVGEPRFDDDAWEAKLELLAADPPAVVSFTFGCPPPDVVARLRDAGSEVWVTVTSADEAIEAAATGADAVIAQGSEAGGHRASFSDRPDLPLYALLPLVQLVAARTELPVVASGGIATGRALAAVLCAGAAAAQIGTAFMLCPEAGTPRVLRDALGSPAATGLTRAFTGRLARGIRNRFMAEHEDAPIAYPEVHYATAPLRQAGRESGEPDVVNLWAGEAHELARAVPAADLVRQLAREARDAVDEAKRLLSAR